MDILFIVQNKNKRNIERVVEEAFVTFGVSARVIAIEEFIKRKDVDSLLKQVVKEHVCISNAQRFVEIIAMK